VAGQRSPKVMANALNAVVERIGSRVGGQPGYPAWLVQAGRYRCRAQARDDDRGGSTGDRMPVPVRCRCAGTTMPLVSPFWHTPPAARIRGRGPRLAA
jgi:hypothetical protein